MRSLNPDEAQLWARVMETVRPLRAAIVPARPAPPPAELLPHIETPGAPKVRVKGRVPPLRQSALPPAAPKKGPGETLDGGWDKRLSRGSVMPDRVLLLVTGKPPRPESERPHARGAIRAAISDWLGASRHADSIAAIRNAHPRHGGQGALYIVFRRPRER